MLINILRGGSVDSTWDMSGSRVYRFTFATVAFRCPGIEKGAPLREVCDILNVQDFQLSVPQGQCPWFRYDVPGLEGETSLSPAAQGAVQDPNVSDTAVAQQPPRAG